MNGRRRSVQLALLVLAAWVLLAVFADLVASEAPLVARTASGVWVLPEVTAKSRWASTDGADLARVEREGFAVWAPIRASAHTRSAAGAFAPPSRAHLLGTDAYARDVLAVTVHGARTVLLTTVIVLVLALGFGLVLGAFAGQGPLVVDALLTRLIELSGALPTLVLLAVLRAGGLLPAWLGFVLVLSLLRTLEVARLVRGEVLRVGGTDYLLAARAIGASTREVILRHALPHMLGPVLVSAAFTAASVVTLEAAFGFVGLGLPNEMPAWGTLLGQVGSGLPLRSLAAPLVAIVTITACCWIVADALDDYVSARRAGPSRV